MCKPMIENSPELSKLDAQWNEFRNEILENSKPVEGVPNDLIFVADNSDIPDLFALFLLDIPVDFRQYYNCNACRGFINRYAFTCVINDDGTIRPWLFRKYLPEQIADNPFRRFSTQVADAIINHGNRVSRCLTIPMKDMDGMLGVDTNEEHPEFNHLMAYAPEYNLDLSKQRVNLDERHKVFVKNMVKLTKQFSTVDNIMKVYVMLNDDIIPMKDKYYSLVGMYLEYAKKIMGMKGHQRNNLLWKYSILAPDALVAFSNTAIGNLIEYLNNGMSDDVAINIYLQMVDSLHYMRPTKEVTSNQTEDAFKLISELGYTEKDFDRKLALFDDIKDHCIWLPKQTKTTSQKDENFFSRLAADKENVESDEDDFRIRTTKTMSFTTFLKEIEAGKYTAMQYLYTPGNTMYAMVAPVHPDAKPILYWDTEENRNPYSWYTRSGTDRFFDPYYDATYDRIDHLTSKTLKRNHVIGIVPLPHMWNETVSIASVGFKGYLFVIKDVEDTANNSSALFPQILKKDLYPIRAVMERYSNQTPMVTPDGDKGKQKACGICITSSMTAITDWRFDFLVTTIEGIKYRIRVNSWE